MMKTMSTPKLLALFGLTAGSLFTAAPGAFAAPSTTQNVTYQVSAISEFAISGSAPTLTINSATAGSDPDSKSSSGITYSVTTNKTGKITAALDSDMPTGVTLTVNAAAPTNAASPGAVSLSTSASDIVTSLDPVSESNLALTYNLSATAEAGVVASSNKTVTFTIVSDL